MAEKRGGRIFKGGVLAGHYGNIDDLYDSTLNLHQLFSSRQEPTFIMASQLTLFGDSTVNTKSTRTIACSLVSGHG